MKNKKKFAFLPLVFATGLILGACGLNRPDRYNSQTSKNTPSQNSSSQGGGSSQGGNSSSSKKDDSSSKSSRPSKSVTKKFIVKFYNGGLPVQISEVEEGKCAVFEGETPVKRGDEQSQIYRFKGWDRDIKLPITADTVFHATFTTYADEMMIDDFENYEDTASMMDEGWCALGYNNTTKTWTTETNAAVSVGYKSDEGNKSLRFDAWENGVGYKFAKNFKANAFPQAANALKFRLMVPSINTVKVILHAQVTIQGTVQAPSFTYTIKPTSSEFVDYIIPLDDDGWALWGEAGKSIKATASWMGVHQDDILNYLTKIEFYVEGNDGNGWPYAAFLDSAKFVTIKDAKKVAEESMYEFDRYTGKLATGNIVRVTLGARGKAVAEVIDLEDPISIPGKYVINADNTLKFTSDDNGQTLVYVGQLKDGAKKCKFVRAEGQLATAVDNMDLGAVQVVDNFDQYEKDGQAYCEKYSDKTKRSGARGAYFSEFYKGSGSSPWGGNGWSLMGGEGDQLKLKTGADAHSGNQYLCLKNSQTYGMRYMQWGLFDGSSDANSFRGEKLGFWAKTKDRVPAFKVSAYSNSAPTATNKDQRVKAVTFEETKTVGDWKHYEVDLNPDLVYYGFMIFMEKNKIKDSFLYIDDVEIYKANPDAVYVPPQPDKQLTAGQRFVGTYMNVMRMEMVIVDDSHAKFYAGVGDAIDATYSYNGNKVTFVGEQGFKYVAMLNSDATAFTGTKNMGSHETLEGVNFVTREIDDNETYTGSGQMYYQNMKTKDSRSGARGAYYCDYYSGGSGSEIGGNGWSLMGGNGDQLSLNTDAQYVHSGNQSLKLKRSTAGTMRYTTWGLHDGSATPHKNAQYFSVWVKNPTTKVLTLRLSVYSQAQVTPSTQQSNRVYKENKIAADGQWHEIRYDLDASKTYYGVSYSVVNDSSTTDYIYVDDAEFYNEDTKMTYFCTFKDQVLAGNIVPGAATIKFDKLGVCYVSCANIGASNVKAKYAVENTSTGGCEMTITLPALTSGGAGTVIKGTYSPIDGNLNMGLTVTSVTGDLAPYVTVGTKFNQQA